MLEITLKAAELFNEETSEFIVLPSEILLLEHSLSSLSKWEASWETPFLSDEEKTREQTLDYIKAMLISPVSSPDVFDRLTSEHFEQISKYIDRKMAATWFVDEPRRPGSTAAVTAEIIYYWMISFQIPTEYQYWHLNKLLTLVKVINEKNAPKKKLNRAQRQEALSNRAMLNAQRKAQLGTTG